MVHAAAIGAEADNRSAFRLLLSLFVENLHSEASGGG
jgi:hypothetical protein